MWAASYHSYHLLPPGSSSLVAKYGRASGREQPVLWASNLGAPTRPTPRRHATRTDLDQKEVERHKKKGSASLYLAACVSESATIQKALHSE